MVIGASAGGVEALTALFSDMPRDIPAACFIVSHMFAVSYNYLAVALDDASALRVKQAEDHEPIRHGVVYVAAPDRHLIVKADTVRVTRGPRANRWRPAIDPLFRPAAVAHGARAIGIVLAGMLDDGTAACRQSSVAAESRSCRTRKKPHSRRCREPRSRTSSSITRSL